MTKPFINSAVIHLNRECRLLVNFEGENDNFRFEVVNNKLSNSLQGKIKWIWISGKWLYITISILDEAIFMDYFTQEEFEKA